MKNSVYFFGFFFLLLFFCALEYFIAPPLFYEGDKNLYETEKENIQKDISRNPLQKNTFEDIFKAAQIQNISTHKSVEVDNLFYTLSLTPEEDDFRVLKTEYFQTNEIQESQKILVVYDIFSTRPRTIQTAYTDIQEKFKKLLEQNIEAEIKEDNQYGNKSFMIRLEEDSKTMYLIVAYRDRLLGFEYPIGKNFSRHDEIEKVFQIFFSQK